MRNINYNRNVSDVTFAHLKGNIGDVTLSTKKGDFMATDKKRVQAYVTQEILDKFKVVSATKRMSMSEYSALLIEKSIEGYEIEHGKIKIESMEK